MSTLDVSRDGTMVRITGSGHDGAFVRLSIVWTGKGDNPDLMRDHRKAAVSPGSDKYAAGDIDLELDIGHADGTVTVELDG